MLRKYAIFGGGEHTMGGRGYPVRRYPIACQQAARPQGSRRSMLRLFLGVGTPRALHSCAFAATS